ncbi:MAG: ABC transporter permease [Candidatus Merdivicinus sp.]
MTVNRSVPKKKSIFFYLKRDYVLYLLLLLPMLVLYFFRYRPMYGVLIAFKDFNLFKGVMGSEWVGLDIFKEIFTDRAFYQVLRNTFVLNSLDLVFGFPVPIILAVMLNELRWTWFKKGAQTILYLPHFLSWIIIGGITIQLLADRGLVNVVLSQMGMEPIPFLTDKWVWLFTYTIIGIWQNAGWGTIIYLAAIMSINNELYDAADVDGATRIKKIWHVTLPGITPTIITLLILNLGRMASIGFDRPYLIGNDLVSDFSEVISTYTYRTGIRSGYFSQATAVGLFQSVVNLIFLCATNFIAKKFDQEGIW